MTLSPLPKDTIELRVNQVYSPVQQVLSDTFNDLEMSGYRYTSETLWDILLYASVNQTSIKDACESLDAAPSYNWVYQVLANPFGDEPLDDLGNDVNAALEATFPPRLSRCPQKIAIDLVLLPFYGQATTEGIRRSAAKGSTTKFFCYATAYLIRKNKRITLVVSFVEPTDTLLDVLERLIQRVSQLGVRIKRLYLDREFASVAILNYLSGQSFVSVVALPKKGAKLKALQSGKKSFITQYKMTAQDGQSIEFPLWVAVRYWKGKHKKHGARYLMFAVLGECNSCILSIANEYRCRFGIEASYRQMNQVRAKTTSKSRQLRLLLVAIAFVLQNVWVWLKWNGGLLLRGKGQRMPSFTLNRMALMLIEHLKSVYRVSLSFKL